MPKPTVSEKNQVATANAITSYQGDISARQAEVGRGSENVTAQDLMIPRLKLLQPLSPACQAGEPEYVEGAQAGMLMNSLTGDLHTSMFLVNLHFTKKVVVWEKKATGSLWGSFETKQEAESALDEAGENQKNYVIKDNPVHLAMLLNEEGRPQGMVIIDMPGTKVKCSQRWNSLIMNAEQEGNPRFGCVWQLGVKMESNTQGKYHVFDLLDIADGVKYIVATDDIYDAAKAEFDKFFGNRKADEEAA